MASSILHALPWIVKNARFTLPFTMLNTAGMPANNGASSPLYQVAVDGGTLATCGETPTNDVPAGSAPLYGGGYFITLTGAETNGSVVKFRASSSTTPNSTTAAMPLMLRGVVRNFPVLFSGTCGSATYTSTNFPLPTVVGYDLVGCLVRTTGGTGGGGTGGANNQARLITAYNTSTGVCTVSPAWEVTPASGTTFDILMTELAANSPVGRFLRSTTDGRTLNVDANNVGDANLARYMGDACPAADTAGYPKVTHKTGTGTGELSLSAGVVDANLAKYLGNACPAADTAGYPKVTIKDGTGIGELDTASGKVLLADASLDAILRTALAESYAADGATGTLTQILYGIQQFLQERVVAGTTLNIKKLDGATNAMTLTLNSATAPTSITRAT